MKVGGEKIVRTQKEVTIPQRDAENAFDYQGRVKRQSGFCRECIEVLTDDLYCPGPARSFSDPAGMEFLQRVWQDNLYDSLLMRADQLSHLNTIAAIQIDAGDGDYAERPVRYQLWGREEFPAWTPPTDSSTGIAAVTIDRYDLTTRYRLWTDEEVSTYVTSKATGTAGGVTSKLITVEPNTYGVIPFGYFWYDLPVRSFYPSSPGTFLRKAEVRIDDRLSRIDECINVHLNPIGVAENVGRDWQPIVQPGRFVSLSGGLTLHIRERLPSGQLLGIFIDDQRDAK